MLEFVDGVADVAGHGNINVEVGIVPVDGESAVQCAAPVGGDGVEGGKGVKEVIGMGAADVLDAKIVDNEGERDWASAVLPEPWGSWSGEVIVLRKVLCELLVCNHAGLFEAVHALLYLNIHPP